MMSQVINRAELQERIAGADLGNPKVRALINNLVIDEVIEQRWKKATLEILPGYPPLDMSGERYLRPVPRCVFSSQSWTVKIQHLWFAG